MKYPKKERKSLCNNNNFFLLKIILLIDFDFCFYYNTWKQKSTHKMSNIKWWYSYIFENRELITRQSGFLETLKNRDSTMYVVHIDCEQFFVHACGLIYTWLVDSNFSQKHSIFNRLIKKETPQNGVFLDVLIIPPQHNFDLPSFITFYFNSSIKLFISQFRILCWQKKTQLFVYKNELFLLI